MSPRFSFIKKLLDCDKRNSTNINNLKNHLASAHSHIDEFSLRIRCKCDQHEHFPIVKNEENEITKEFKNLAKTCTVFSDDQCKKCNHDDKAFIFMDAYEERPEDISV